MKILVFGNHLVKQDNLPLRILPQLKQNFPNIEFKELDSTETLQNETDENKNLTILDTAIDIDQIKTIALNTQEDFKKLQLPNALSMHDFDLAYNLRLLKKVNLINQVKIICVPMEMQEEEASSQLQSIFKKCVAHDIQGS